MGRSDSEKWEGLSQKNEVWLRKSEGLTQESGKDWSKKMGRSDSEKWEELTKKHENIWLKKWEGLTQKSGNDWSKKMRFDSEIEKVWLRKVERTDRNKWEGRSDSKMGKSDAQN